MSKQYRLERRVQSHPLIDFDDQRWPIACALVTLAGLVSGVIWGRSDFDSPDLLKNGWAQLGGVAIALVVLIWSSALLDGRILRRVQLCILLSLMLHLGLVFVMREQYLSVVAIRERETEQARQESLETPPVVLPEYDFTATFEPVTTDEQLEQPVQTVDAEAVDESLARQAEHDSGVEMPHPELPQPTQEVEGPTPLDVQRAELSAPKQAVTAGDQLSRQELQPEFPPTEPILSAEVREAPQAEPLSPRPSDTARQAEALSPEPSDLDQAQAPDPQMATPAAAALRERASAPALPDIESTASTTLRTRAAISPDAATETELVEPVARQENAQAELAPTTAAAPKRANTSASAIATPAPQEPSPTAAASRRADTRRAVEPTSSPAVQSTADAPTARTATQIDPSAVADTAEPQTSVGPASDAPLNEAAPVANQWGRAPNNPIAAQPTAVNALAPSDVASAPATVTGAGTRRAAITTRPAEAPSASPTAILRESVPADLAGTAAGEPTEAGEATTLPAAKPGGVGELQPAAPANRITSRAGATQPPTASQMQREAVGSVGELSADSQARSNRPAVNRTIPRRVEVPVEGNASAGSIAGSRTSGSGTSGDNRVTASAADLSAATDSTADFPDIGPTPDGPSGTTRGEAGAPQTVRATERTATGSAGELAPANSNSGRLSASSVPLPRGSVARASPGGTASSQPAFDAPAPARMAAGLRRDRSPALGLNDPLARPQSESLLPSAERFVLERSFGAPTVNARITENPIPEFRQRKPAERERNATSRGATAGSEKAVELGLDFLARHQSPDGRWTLDKFNNGRPGYESAGLAQMQSDTAATGLALLAYFGAGYTHLDGKYRLAVGRALDYLVSNQKPDGDLFTSGSQYVWLYSHGIASIALCEAYGMTRDPRLREPAQRALNFIVAAQHPTQGGWRYSPQRESDTSVSGWQMMALKSGELSGLTVPRTTYDRLSGWLDFAQAGGQDGSRYVYLPASRQLQQRSPSMVMTAEALLMRLYLGWERSDARLIAGAEYLLANLPDYGTPNRPTRDAYYWYYATQVMFQVQGPHWEAWNAQLRDLLVNAQVQEGFLAGSWDPIDPLPDRWGRQAGRVYVTAMHLLMLEVYYRHLPLYRTLGK